MQCIADHADLAADCKSAFIVETKFVEISVWIKYSLNAIWLSFSMELVVGQS